MDVCMYNVYDIQTCTHGGGEWPKEFANKSKKETLFFKTCILSWHALKKYNVWFHDSKKKSCMMSDILIDVILTWNLIISMSKIINSKLFNNETCN